MRIKIILLNIIGLIALSLGAIGIIIPVLPTTPFVLLAAGCFSVSSPRLLKFVKKNKFFGYYIDNYQTKSGVPVKIKVRAIIFLWVGLIASMLLNPKPMFMIMLGMIGTGVTIHLLTIKTSKN